MKLGPSPWIAKLFAEAFSVWRALSNAAMRHGSCADRQGISAETEANLFVTAALKSLLKSSSVRSLCAAVWLVTASVALGQGDDRLAGIWIADQGYRTVELLFRSDGVYQSDIIGAGYDIMDRGRYTVAGQSLTLTSYQYFGQPAPKIFQFQLVGDSLSLSGYGSDLSDEYQLEPGSRADVLAREQANSALVRRWTRHILFTGDEECLFRPGGYYAIKTTHENPVFVEFDRGRYDLAGDRLAVKPYSGGEAPYQVDVFGSTLTLIGTNSYSGWFTSYEEVPGSYEEVTNKAAEALAFISRPNWQAGVWQIQDEDNTIDLLLRPDGIYSATNASPVVNRVLRGRYTLADLKMHMVPFIGQEWFVLDNDNFGMSEKNFLVDYYDSVLQVIEIKPHQQCVLLGQELPGSEAAVLKATRQAQAERARDGWYLGIWEVPAPGAWMEFTFRPDNRYIAKSGALGVPSQVERGRYVAAPSKFTLAPYPANGAARGFEFDLYAGDLFLIGDSQRLVLLRKIPGSETGVSAKALDPAALKGERGSILGRWTANRPTESVELVFRQDGQFRFKRCTNNVTYFDYGLYTVDMASRTLVYDSRFDPVQTRRLEFYGDTMTIYGGLSETPPSTYTVNLGSVDEAIAASFAADAQEAQVDAQWLARVPIGPRDPNAVPPPDLPADPHPDKVFPDPTVFSKYEYYRWIIYNWEGKMDSHQWHFFPTGRVLVRLTFREQVTDFWGAYQIGPEPIETDILHCYADNALTLLMDHDERLDMTLEDGRRNLFWAKEDEKLAEWALEQVPIACQLPGNPDATLINTGVKLSSAISPDPIPFPLIIGRPVEGSITVSGTTDLPLTLILERAGSLAPPLTWQPLQSNNVPAGPFSFTISGATDAAGFFRIRVRSQ